MSSEEEDQQNEEQGKLQFTGSADLPNSPPQPREGGVTPNNTPNVSLFSKSQTNSGGAKRSFEGQPAPQDKAVPEQRVNELLNKLAVSEGRDPEDEDEDEDDDEDDEDEEEEEEYVATPEQVEAVLPLLRENQNKIEDLKQKYQEERRELELKFQALRNVIYNERAAAVKGEDEGEGPALPGFWLNAMQKNILLSQFIEEWDEPALIFLDDVTCEELTEEFGFKLTFKFAKNPFFSNETLTKKIVVSNLYAPDYVMPEIDQSVGTDIKWHPGQNLTVRVEVKEIKRAARRGGKKGGAKEVRQEVPQESFFTFFETRVEKTPEEQEKMPDEEQDAYHRDWETDFAIASTFRAKLIPDATLWYTGEASDSEYGDDDEEDYEGEEEEDDDEDDDDDDEDEDEDDDDEDEDEPKPAKNEKKKGGKPAQSAGGQQGENPECKQQ